MARHSWRVYILSVVGVCAMLAGAFWLSLITPDGPSITGQLPGAHWPTALVTVGLAATILSIVVAFRGSAKH